jgi:DNA-binding transcriptional LysR family regulator
MAPINIGFCEVLGQVGRLPLSEAGRGKMDRLEAMAVLLAAVDTGSLSAASRRLRIPLPTVSRRVAELEEHLRVRLLLRGNRKLTLTDTGRDYVVSCRRIMEELAEVERAAAGEYRNPRGELIISAPTIMGRMHALPVVVEFLRAHADIRMRVELSDRIVDLLEEHVDLALRVGELPDSSMIAARVGSSRPVVCASPAYLKIRGVPKTPADLASHECITYQGHYSTRDNWEFQTKGASHTVLVPSRLAVYSADAAVAAATADAGIARVFSFQIVDLVKAGALVKLLEAYEPSPVPVNLIYPGQRLVPLKLRAFLDFSIPRLRDRLDYRSP